jgi:hypothetical protein
VFSPPRQKKNSKNTEKKRPKKKPLSARMQKRNLEGVPPHKNVWIKKKKRSVLSLMR